MKTITKTLMIMATIALMGCSDQSNTSAQNDFPEIDMEDIMAQSAAMMESGEMQRVMAMTMSTQRMTTVNECQVMVQWMPPQAHEMIMEITAEVMEESAIDPETWAEIQGLREETLMITVTDMSSIMNPDGDTGLGDDLIDRIRIRTPDGVEHAPLSEQNHMDNMPSEIAKDMKDMPFDMEAMMDLVHLFEFPNVVDPTAEGTFAIIIDDTEIVWDLPIVAFMTERVCPEDGEKFPGDFEFCPRHSVELN